MNPWEEPPFWADTREKAEEYRRKFTGDREEHLRELHRKAGEDLWERLPPKVRGNIRARFLRLEDAYCHIGENRNKYLEHVEGALKDANPHHQRRYQNGPCVEEVTLHGRFVGV